MAACVAVALAGIGNGVAVAAVQDGDTGTITVHLRQCEEVASDGNYYPVCHDNPFPDVSVSAFTDGEGGLTEGTTDAAGNLDLAVAPGTYFLSGPAGESFDSRIVCSPDDTPGVPVAYPVTLAAGERVVCDYYVVPGSAAGPEGELPLGQGFAIGAINCETDPGGYNPRSAQPLPEGCEAAVGVAVTVATPDGTEIASCTIRAVGGCNVDAGGESDVVVTEDAATLPDGFVPKENPIETVNATEFAGAFFINVRQDDANAEADETGQGAEATEPAPAEPEERDGRSPALHAGACDDLGDVVGDLTGLDAPEGDAAGAEDAIAVETSFTRLDLALDNILAADHAIGVFAADGETLVACGAVGGVVADDGSLTVGLRETDGSGVAGVAFLAPDGDETTVTVFLAEGLAADSGAAD